MAGLSKRLDRLEKLHAASPERRKTSEEDRKRHWLAVAKAYRSQDRHPSEWHARGIIELLRIQGRLPRTTEKLRARLLAWRPPIDTRAIECVLARAIYDQDEGTESMVCPPGWHASFVAREQLLASYGAVPDETLARWAIWEHDLEEGAEDDVQEKLVREANVHGITEELMLMAIGPDAEEAGEEECARRLRDILADLYCGEKGYRVQQHIDRERERKEHIGLGAQ